MMKHRRFAHVPTAAVFLTLLAGSGAWAQGTLHIIRPIEGATVRETVPVKIAPSDLPTDGYVSITIDGVFRSGRVLPNGNDAAYLWDTKAPYTTTDDPDTKQYIKDGTHTLTVQVFSGGKEVGNQTVSVKVANAIATPSQGVMLAYSWRPNQTLTYQRQTQLDDVTSGSPVLVQSASVLFTRSVEDAGGGTFLVRDHVSPDSTLNVRGVASLISAAYNIKSVYRSVTSYGQVVDTMAPLSPGDHFGFSIPVLPGRRVAIGDAWQSPVQISLQWASTAPGTVVGESHLEAFEWENGYPTARIRETYNGSAQFPNPADGSTITLDNVQMERMVWFAYNSGRLIRSVTTMNVTAALTSAEMTALGVAGSASNTGTGGLNINYSPQNGQVSVNGSIPGISPGIIPGLPSTSPTASAVGAAKTTITLKATESTDIVL